MTKSKKWSEQLLKEETFKTQENGKEVINKKNVLTVCTSGRELFRKEFMSKYKNALDDQYEFIVVAGTPCPRGRFYELEYQLGDNGLVYRALLQLVGASTDISVVLSALRSDNILPHDFKPLEARLTDIDEVHIGRCSKEDGEAVMYSSIYRESPEDHTILLHVSGPIGACLEYYRGDVREVWASYKNIGDYPRVFVCQESCDDVYYADIVNREANDIIEEIEEKLERLKDLGRKYVFLCENENKDYIFDINAKKLEMVKIIAELTKS